MSHLRYSKFEPSWVTMKRTVMVNNSTNFTTSVSSNSPFYSPSLWWGLYLIRTKQLLSSTMIYTRFILYLAQRVAAVPPQEDANQVFFVCTKYSEIRNDLFLSISDLSQLINTSLLTSGSETLSYADNCFIFDSVFRFIKRSKWFLIV